MLLAVIRYIGTKDLTSQMNWSGVSQFSCNKLLVFAFTAMQFGLAMGSETLVVVLVEHQVTSAQDFFFPLVQKRSCAGNIRADWKIAIMFFILEFTCILFSRFRSQHQISFAVKSANASHLIFCFQRQKSHFA
jgi:hypothetical protein